MITRIRSLIRKGSTECEQVQLNQVIEETVALAVDSLWQSEIC